MKYLMIVILMVLVGCQDDSIETYSDDVYKMVDLTMDRCDTEQYTDEEYLDFVLSETCGGDNTNVYIIILNHYAMCGSECPLDGIPDGCTPVGTECN